MLRLRSSALTNTSAFATRRFLGTSRACLASPPELAATMAAMKRSLAVLSPGFDPEKIDAFAHEEDGLGAKLQLRVAEKDSFNNDHAFGRGLAARTPLPVKSNWWFLLNDHPNHPKSLIGKPPPKDVISSFQIDRASGIIFNLLALRDLTVSDSKYEGLFGSARIPGESADSFETSSSRHIVVLTKNQVYRVDVIDSNGNKASVRELQRILYAIGADSLESEVQPSVGLLTTMNRTEWAQSYHKLAKLSIENQQNLDTIASALFSISIDDHSTIANENYSHQQFAHNFNGRNRWFDKSVQVILASSGRAGINAEVSIVDPSLHVKLAEYLANNEPVIADESKALQFPDPIKLKWTVDAEIENAIAFAEEKMKSLASTTESVLLKTDILGERYINEVARSDSDAFVQIALQITWQRLHKVPTATSVAVPSKTVEGKLSSGLNTSKEVWDFVESFDNDDILYDDKRTMFRTAMDSLTQSAQDIGEGLSVSSHLASLYQAADESETEELVSLFGSGIAQGMRKVGLDTVNIGQGSSCFAGFGQSAANGYGIAYSVGQDNMMFTVSNKKSASTRTNAYRFVDTLKRTFADMMFLFPKRSEVWGYDWKDKFARKRKEEFYLQTMKKLSDGYLAKKGDLTKKYASQMRK
ncbi:Choline/Carnitine o-acyltransferase-domain-containing protein [Chytriomyces sp. MP71]|nr:Choline/Carnitine o-acyltransferase-domain-containing protein [Chytriomyces sp. MP71]